MVATTQPDDNTKPHLDEARLLLDALFGDAPDGTFVEIRMFGGDEAPRQVFLTPGHGWDLKADWDGAVNVYYGVCLRKQRGGKAHDVALATCVWADDAKLPLPEGFPQPSAIVETSPGKFQHLWLLREPTNDLAAVEGINHRLAYMLQADNVGDRARILRLPGYVNLKYPDRPRARIDLIGEVRYTLEQMDSALPQVVRGETGEPGAPEQPNQEIYSSLLQPRKAGERTNAMVRLMGHFCALGETRTTIFRILSLWNEKNLPPLEPAEFEYQFEQMYSRWGAPREELTFEEEVRRAVENVDDPHERREALIHILDGKRLPAMEYELWSERLKSEYGLAKRVFAALVRKGSRNRTSPEPQIPQGPVPELAPLLDEVAAFYRRFVVLTKPQGDTLALWTAHSHAIEAAETTPYINVCSAEKESGKTRTGEVANCLVARPLTADSISPAALARSVDQGATLILDEADTIFGRGRRPASETAEMLRGLLDGGWRRGGQYVRMVGDGTEMHPQRFQTFGAKMIIGIGGLPGTLSSRAVKVVLKRRLPSEGIEKFRVRKVKPEAERLNNQLAIWGAHSVGVLQEAEPPVPEELSDRMSDSWEPLLAIADLAGGDWPERARKAAKELSRTATMEDDSKGVELLYDLRLFFDGAARPTHLILEHLNAPGESSWGHWNAGTGMKPQDLAKLLRPFGVKSKNLRLPTGQMKGYDPEDFQDAFSRYLSVYSAEKNIEVPPQFLRPAVPRGV
ncbi:MAG: hypothetical protein HW388_1240 [Dehalococcoidia bacterium]|nr:hypothetical protein [Dehalococcoidia bacterium]